MISWLLWFESSVCSGLLFFFFSFWVYSVGWYLMCCLRTRGGSWEEGMRWNTVVTRWRAGLFPSPGSSSLLGSPRATLEFLGTRIFLRFSSLWVQTCYLGPLELGRWEDKAAAQPCFRDPGRGCPEAQGPFPWQAPPALSRAPASPQPSGKVHRVPRWRFLRRYPRSPFSRSPPAPLPRAAFPARRTPEFLPARTRVAGECSPVLPWRSPSGGRALAVPARPIPLGTVWGQLPSTGPCLRLLLLLLPPGSAQPPPAGAEGPGGRVPAPDGARGGAMMRGRRLRAACGRGGSSGTRRGVAAAAVAASGAARAACGARGARPGAARWAPPGEGAGGAQGWSRWLGGGGGEGGGAVAASLWQESFGAARRGRPAACVPGGGGGGDPLPVRGPACPRPLRQGGCSPTSPSLSPASRPLAVPSLGPGPLGSCGGDGEPSAGRSAGGVPWGVFRAGCDPGGAGERCWAGMGCGTGGAAGGGPAPGAATPDESLGKQRPGNRDWSGGGGRRRGSRSPVLIRRVRMDTASLGPAARDPLCNAAPLPSPGSVLASAPGMRHPPAPGRQLELLEGRVPGSG